MQTGTVYDKTLVKFAIAPALRANGTVNGTAVDRAEKGGAEEALVTILAGTITDGSHAVTIEDSDTGAGGWVAVPAGQLQGALPTLVAADDDKVFEVGVGWSRRFLRVVVVTTGATTGGIVGAVIALGDLRHRAH